MKANAPARGADDEAPVDGLAVQTQKCQRNRRRDQHTDRLQRDGRDHHAAARAFRHGLGDIRGTDREIDPDADADQKLTEQHRQRVLCERTENRTGGQDRHVEDQQRLAPEPVGGRPAESSAERSAQHQSRTDQPDHQRAKFEAAGEQRHRHAKREDREPIQ
jgi:hypothetical protein